LWARGENWAKIFENRVLTVRLLRGEGPYLCDETALFRDKMAKKINSTRGPAMRRTLYSRAALFISLIVISPACVFAQTGPSEADLLATAREIITNARFCALITLSTTGEPQARTIDPLFPDEKMTVWFSTNPLTRKVKEIRVNQKVALHYFDPKAQAYVTLKGTAELVDDPKEKRVRWKEEWAPYYPDRDKSFLLVRVTPSTLEVVNISKGMLGDPKTWHPHTVTFGAKK
jgi:general stress protein 26